MKSGPCASTGGPGGAALRERGQTGKDDLAVGSKEQYKQADQKQIIEAGNVLAVARWEGGWRVGGKGEGVEQDRSVVTEPSQG